MKFLKGLGTFLLSMLAFSFVFIFSISLITKNVVQKGVVGSIVKNVIVEEFAGENDLSAKDKENIKKVNEVIKTDDINELVDIILDEYDKSLDDENYEVSEKTVDYIVDLLVEYKDLINDITKENVTEKEIRSKETREGITNALNEILSESSEGNEEALRIAVTSYHIFVSNTFRLTMIFFTIICFILIALIKKSYFKWMKEASGVLITTGGLITACYFAILVLFDNINNSSNYQFIINPTFIAVLGISEVIIGILFIIATVVTSKNEND